MMRTLLATLALALLVGCMGKSSTVEAADASQFINETCPMMGGAVDPEVASVDWNGHAVGFCCGGCGDKFSALSEDEKVAKLKEHGADI